MVPRANERKRAARLGHDIRRAAFAGLCVLALGSCEASLEKAQLAFTPDSSGQITLRIAVEAEDDQIEADELIAQIENCGFEGRHFRRAEDIVLDAQYEFANQTIMNSNLDCLPLQWTRRDVSIDVSKGLLWTTYVTHVWIEQPTVVPATEPVEEPAATVEEAEPVEEEAPELLEPEGAAADGAAPDDELMAITEPAGLDWEGSYPLFPVQLTVRVPGTIDEVSTEGTDLIFAELSHAFSNNRATIDMAYPRPGWSDADDKRFSDGQDRLIAALERGEKRKIPLYTYKVEIESSESHLNLSTLLTVLGLVLSSGLLGRLFAVRAAKRKATSDES